MSKDKMTTGQKVVIVLLACLFAVNTFSAVTPFLTNMYNNAKNKIESVVNKEETEPENETPETTTETNQTENPGTNNNGNAPGLPGGSNAQLFDIIVEVA